jgi:3-methylcrotonyl-CoA carboxylase alpha subunit
MRIVEATGDFAAALASCQREAVGSFGNGAVLIEKYVQRPRHIEIQVFGDSLGNYVYLFERDCSVQRRHQKVLEEAPAPGMTEALRAQMGAAAVAAARAVNYVGAGTVEFIVEQASYDQPEAMVFYFMEMNTRLQVEHPVTEAITGLDLVEWQLRVASGEPLPLRQDELQITGHAIEARICAETPDKQFLPATGTLGVHALPAHSSFARADYGVRVDSGVRQGDTISPYYDSMVAKLIVHGRTRAEALARMDAALAQTHIVGLNTNVQFLRHVVASDAFVQARLDTALIPREAATLFDQEKVGLAWAGAALVADTLRLESAAADAGEGWKDPWAARDSWQSHAAPVRNFALEFAGAPHNATLRPTRNGAAQLECGGVNAALNFTVQADGSLDMAWGNERQRLQVYRQGETAHVFLARGATQIVAVDALAHAAVAQADTGRLTAPMPGKLLSFAVKAGDVVRQGQALAVMDAMKMEHTISAPANGTVQELLYAPGDQVAEGAELLRLAVAVAA